MGELVGNIQDVNIEPLDTPWSVVRNNIDNAVNAVEIELSQRYPYTMENGKRIYHSDKAGFFHIDILRGLADVPFFVIDYMKDYEDGDGFFPVDYDSLDTLVSDVITEIEG